MAEEYDIKAIAEKIKSLRKNAEELKKISDGIPTVERNVERLLASVKMLEISISDVVEISDN